MTPVEKQLAELRAGQRRTQRLAGGFIVAVLALLIVGAPMAMAGGYDSGGWKSGGGVAGQDITPATVTTTGNIFAGGDLHVNTNGFVYLNGSSRTVGITYDGTNVRITNPGGVTPNSAGSGNLGSSAIPWSDSYTNVLHLGGTTKTADSSTAPTVTACAGGTAASITAQNGSAAFQFDVGTACTSESTAVITLPSNAAGWKCSCDVTTADRMLTQRVLPSASATTVTMQHVTISTGANTDFTDSADVSCECRGL